MNIKKHINFVLWIALIISFNALGIITDRVSDTKTINNISNTGITLNTEYQSSLDIGDETINIYSYIEQLGGHHSSTNLNTPAKMLFAIIPRTIGCTGTPSIKTSEDKILRMNTYLNKHSINKPSILPQLEYYLSAYSLEESFNTEKKALLVKALQGSHGLFMPLNMQQLDKFNGFGRTLSVGVTILDNLLLTRNDFNSTSINQKNFVALQKQIFEIASDEKTVIFIPECISRKASGKLRLPIAMINKVVLNQEDQTITLNLLFHQNTKDDFSGFEDFKKTRTALVTKTNNTDNQWEFIDYTFKITANNDFLYYSFDNAQVQHIGKIEQNNIAPQHPVADSHHHVQNFTNNNNALLDEARAPTDEELTNINKTPTITVENRTPTHENSANIDDASEITANKNRDFIDSKKIKYPCEHYERKCLVKLPCCDEYVPCHRCHNEIYKGHPDHIKKTKSKDIIGQKCLSCNHKQPFNPETSQYCQSCNLKFSEYYCSFCKHLTGHSDSPYHCDKCGICRIHGDRSFHCDVCGVCLDVQLKDNHKCRKDSAHDDCCICLEDAFTGCQILPCSHKVHKQCATEMIRAGITRCPICRESFAYKLERRQLSKKRGDH